LKKRKLVQSALKACVRFGPLGFQPSTDAHPAVHTLPWLVALAACVAGLPFVLAVGFKTSVDISAQSSGTSSSCSGGKDESSDGGVRGEARRADWEGQGWFAVWLLGRGIHPNCSLPARPLSKTCCPWVGHVHVPCGQAHVLGCNLPIHCMGNMHTT
jgi:hypothetical protein